MPIWLANWSTVEEAGLSALGLCFAVLWKLHDRELTQCVALLLGVVAVAAVRLQQNFTQRQQLKEQHHKHSAFAANHTSPLQLRHTFSPLAASQGSKQNRWQGSFSGIRQDITSTANRTLSQSSKPEQLVQGRLYTSDKIRTAEDPCGLNVDELRQDLELVLKRV